MSKRQLSQIAEIEGLIKQVVYQLLGDLGYHPDQVSERKDEDKRYRPIRRPNQATRPLEDRDMERLVSPDVTRAVDAWDSIERMHADMRAVLMLSHDGYTKPEISRILGFSHDKVSTLWESGRAALCAPTGDQL